MKCNTNGPKTVPFGTVPEACVFMLNGNVYMKIKHVAEGNAVSVMDGAVKGFSHGHEVVMKPEAQLLIDGEEK